MQTTIPYIILNSSSRLNEHFFETCSRKKYIQKADELEIPKNIHEQ